jgi:hypothetical protein
MDEGAVRRITEHDIGARHASQNNVLGDIHRGPLPPLPLGVGGGGMGGGAGGERVVEGGELTGMAAGESNGSHKPFNESREATYPGLARASSFKTIQAKDLKDSTDPMDVMGGGFIGASGVSATSKEGGGRGKGRAGRGAQAAARTGSTLWTIILKFLKWFIRWL